MVQTAVGQTVGSGADSIAYTSTVLASGDYSWTAVATDVRGATSGTSAVVDFICPIRSIPLSLLPQYRCSEASLDARSLGARAFASAGSGRAKPVANSRCRPVLPGGRMIRP